MATSRERMLKWPRGYTKNSISPPKLTPAVRPSNQGRWPCRASYRGVSKSPAFLCKGRSDYDRVVMPAFRDWSMFGTRRAPQ
jgi:hypothetical protein